MSDCKNILSRGVSLFVFFIFEVFFGLFFIGLRIARMVVGLVYRTRQGLSEPLNPTGKGPILLVHGLNMDDLCLRILRSRFYKENWGPIYLLNLGPFSWTISEHAHLLKDSCESLFAKYGKIHVVAHSMGGVVARYYLQEMAGQKTIQSLVTLATPHQGTSVARFAYSVSGRQLIPGGKFMKDLDHPEKTLPGGVRYLFLWGNLDWIVPPRWGGCSVPDSHFHSRSGEFFRFLPDHGHTGFLLTRKAYQEISTFLGTSG